MYNTCMSNVNVSVCVLIVTCGDQWHMDDMELCPCTL